MEQDNINRQIIEQYSTFKALPWFPSGTSSPFRVTIGGAGGIGSWLALFLTRAGFVCTIYDDDYIEERNLGGQFYKESDIGEPKVYALQRNILEFSPNGYLRKEFSRITGGTGFYGDFIAAFDNMQARADAFQAWIRSTYPSELSPSDRHIFIDGRLEAEFLQIYCVRRDNIEEIEAYKKTLDLSMDNVTDNVLCSAKQTTHVAAMIGSLMTAFYTNFITNCVEKSDVRFVPFKYEFFVPLAIGKEYGTDSL